ncbi:alpha/beta-hydrolase [Pleomassaria siparia CBS 279.74]|uniref:Alpha/beta-hydrolase n=1 Tax=Pleomassaria siparia CBS 279.74 TaxID=1314801 RepID=A0A6G1JY53_9PLEO|nr:alpha/beta-hydrolase [Pleomassaria siparia CBS 279.74]
MGLVAQKIHDSGEKARSKTQAALDFAQQATKLGQYAPDQEDDAAGSTQAVEAKFITAQDPVIQTADGGRLPAVPVEEAIKLNSLRDVVDEHDPSQQKPVKCGSRESRDGTMHGAKSTNNEPEERAKSDATLQDSSPPSKTNPLFPPLPLYGPPTLGRRIQCYMFRVSSAILSLCFLLVIILGAAFTSIPLAVDHIWLRLTFRNPDKRRPFFKEEERRKKARRAAEREWNKQRKNRNASRTPTPGAEEGRNTDEYIPLEGGHDYIPCDVRYYARRVGLDCEVFKVQTEDGFIIDLWHLYNPRDYLRKTDSHLSSHSPDIFPDGATNGPASSSPYASGNKKYPVLMIHGLLQSAGAYCTNDDDSLAFFLAKSGYDVWLGNNRCGFNPHHSMLQYSDPRMWAWNIRQMGVLDLPALISRVLSETGFPKLGLICHSQGTTQTFVALAKEQRPEIGDKISVFCALAPAAYAGPLVGKMYFKFMRVISPAMFRIFFGIHAFIPIMMTMHSLLPPKFYGAMGYRVFSFMFNWTDDRWERDLRDRMFQFAPVYVSAESMRWWLGRECFAKQKCILATREEKIIEDKEDEQEDAQQVNRGDEHESSDDEDSLDRNQRTRRMPRRPRKVDENRAKYAWYGPRTPPFAFWVCGADELVDGRRLLRRFERNREPQVDVVHAKVIEGYEHLDVIWAMDAIEKVGKEVREVLWRTADGESRKLCRVPKGCEGMTDFYKRSDKRESTTRNIDATAGEWSEKGRKQVGGEARQEAEGKEEDRTLDDDVANG